MLRTHSTKHHVFTISVLILEVGSRHQNEACGYRWPWNTMDAKFGFCIKFYARIQIFRLLGPPKLFLWPFKTNRFVKNYVDFPHENKSGGNISPKFIFIWRSHIKILENSNFQTAVKIVWQVVFTENFEFRHKFRCRIWIWHPFCFRFNGYYKPRSDVENRLRELIDFAVSAVKYSNHIFDVWTKPSELS